jgi:hypothetical protein
LWRKGQHDLQRARAIALWACGGDVSLGRVYVKLARGRALGLTGLGSRDCGDEEFWRLTSALPDVLRKEHALTGGEVRRVLDRAA